MSGHKNHCGNEKWKRSEEQHDPVMRGWVKQLTGLWWTKCLQAALWPPRGAWNCIRLQMMLKDIPDVWPCWKDEGQKKLFLLLERANLSLSSLVLWILINMTSTLGTQMLLSCCGLFVAGWVLCRPGWGAQERGTRKEALKKSAWGNY